MFWKPSEKQETIGSLNAEGRNLAFACGWCDCTTIVPPDQTNLGDEIEVGSLDRLLACPECRYSNDLPGGSHLLHIKAGGPAL